MTPLDANGDALSLSRTAARSFLVIPSPTPTFQTASQLIITFNLAIISEITKSARLATN